MGETASEELGDSEGNGDAVNPVVGEVVTTGVDVIEGEKGAVTNGASE